MLTTSTTNTTTALIADDEPLLREQLILRLAKSWPALTIAAESANGALAVSAYEAHQPDIVFLDIHMPLMNGLDAAKAISAMAKSQRRHVEIVFITAYDQYAIEAFHRGAIDYVLKPYDVERLNETIERLKSRIQLSVSDVAQNDTSAALADAIRQINEKLQPSATYLQWIKSQRRANGTSDSHRRRA
ncbi:MAG: response regulator, partial [Gammaproteobacteria bacterium]|nr:response regulator [Gammaproteobacteria bacterium]